MITKLDFMQGKQCLKSLWLTRCQNEVKSTQAKQQQVAIETGIAVGELARELFPDGVEVDFEPQNFSNMVDNTTTLINREEAVIYEATFHVDDLLVRSDILVKEGSKWNVYEVKDSTNVKDDYINDAGFQWHVLSKVLKLNKVYIIHINNKYVRKGDLDIGSLFSFVDITEQVLAVQPEIPKLLSSMKQTIEGIEPNIPIGVQCSEPYECAFKSHCWRSIPSPSVFDLYRMRSPKKFELFTRGVLSFEEIPDDFRLTETQRLQVSSHLSQKVHISGEGIEDFLGTLVYPIHFFDFETFHNAIPRFNKQKPFMQMPFQYSLHVLYEDGRLEHKEFLGDEFSDPRPALCQKMIVDILPKGSIVAFNKGFEINQIRKLIESFPEYGEFMEPYIERFKDLITPFRSLNYYHPDFNGSFSIKSVLPAMFPNEAELDYKKLEIQNGGMAMDIFAHLHHEKDSALRNRIRRALLDYCHLDTLAMVRIFQKIKSEV
jgi:hypothetical protein